MRRLMGCNVRPPEVRGVGSVVRPFYSGSGWGFDAGAVEARSPPEKTECSEALRKKALSG
ncbi:hypothetical protein SBA5_30088 [Candidatus Sulfotelmatomonas gaucii]|uniref:Uncharacterized protein n=1 Tax=Candidatus Sulfuritelmatomonas gaucii TaxID=2043161 RepID=A0A2N9LCM0_9BACT|nr:hypothetical protein SBA5_30088 [Candidatus Sulfotelmatomonas gaucii]